MLIGGQLAVQVPLPVPEPLPSATQLGVPEHEEPDAAGG